MTSHRRSSRGRRSTASSARRFRGSVRTTILVALLLAPSPAWAHAFPDHSDPRVGHTVDAAPTQVRIWFDGEIEPVFSTIRVENACGQRVDKGDGHVDAQDNPVLEAKGQPGPAPGNNR